MSSNPKNVRRCVVCKKHRPKDELIRIVVTDGEARVDESGRADGRGAYICKDGDCVKQLIKKKSLNYAFRQNVGERVYGELEDGR